MYDDIGMKIKGLAKIMFYLESILIMIIALPIAYEADALLLGIIIVIIGMILAWISTFLLYGFGELIDKACDIERNTSKLYKPTQEEKERLKQMRKAEINMKKGIATNIKLDENGVSYCPACSKKLYFMSGMEITECPHCGCKIKSV